MLHIVREAGHVCLLAECKELMDVIAVYYEKQNMAREKLFNAAI